MPRSNLFGPSITCRPNVSLVDRSPRRRVWLVLTLWPHGCGGKSGRMLRQMPIADPWAKRRSPITGPNADHRAKRRSPGQTPIARRNADRRAKRRSRIAGHRARCRSPGQTPIADRRSPTAGPDADCRANRRSPGQTSGQVANAE